MIKRKRTDEKLRSEIGDKGEGQMPGGWAPSLKMINEKKSKDSGMFNDSGYYNGTAMSVKEMIRAFENPESLASSAFSASSREASSSMTASSILILSLSSLMAGADIACWSPRPMAAPAQTSGSFLLILDLGAVWFSFLLQSSTASCIYSIIR